MKSNLVALFILIPTLACAEEKKVNPATLKHPVKACLFKVEGNGLQKPSWLFGTIHLGDPSVTTLHPKAEAAFEKADAVYTEIDFEPGSQMAMVPLLIRKDGKTLTQALGPDLASKVQERLKTINPALAVSNFDATKTWVLAIGLPLLKLQISGQSPLDDVLYQRAAKASKKVGALETAASQADLFDQFSEEEIQSLLRDTIKVMSMDEEIGIDSLTRLLNVYLTSDVTQIGAYMKEEMAKMDSNPKFTARLMKALLDDRNIAMAEKSDKLMKEAPESSHFIAVGAAHYTGVTAIQDLLKKKGYTITSAFD